MCCRTQPFVVNGKQFWPPCRGVYFEVEGKGYARHAWATASGVTYRMRALMYKSNKRAGKELIPLAEIKQMSSKSHRIAMATLMMRQNVPAAEIVAMGEWEDEPMMMTYVRNLEPFAPEQRSYTEVCVVRADSRKSVVASRRLVPQFDSDVHAQVMYGGDNSQWVEHPLVEAQAQNTAHVHDALSTVAVAGDDAKKQRRAESVAHGRDARKAPCCHKYTKNPLRDKERSSRSK